MNNSKAPYEVVYSDSDVLVVYKKRDVLSVKTADKKTFCHNLYYYLKNDELKNGENLFVVQRLDFENSGLMLFARNENIQKKLQEAFTLHQVERDYEAVIKEPVEPGKTFHVEMRIADNGSEAFESENGKLSISDIEAVNPIQIGTAVRIKIATGRHNQIRLAIKKLGFTLVGDKRYSHDDAKRLYLNSYSLTFPSSVGLKVAHFEVTPLWIKETSPK